MLLLHATNIQKSFGVKDILDVQEIKVQEGDKIGIVGPNGCGKSTLLGILAGEIEPDSGQVSRSWEVCFLRQFDEQDPARSGGENVKARIQQTTIVPNQLLFADEPTANLDEDGQKWVRQRLKQASTLLLVSHDQQLLDEICTKILAFHDGKLEEHTGNYSSYAEAARLKKEQQQQAHTEYQQKKSQLEAAIQRKEKVVSSMNASTKRQIAKNASETRLYRDSRSIKKKQVQKETQVLRDRLSRLETVDRQKEPPGLRIDFSLTNPPGNKHVITASAFQYAYGEKRIFQDASFVVPNRAKIAVTGKNGVGKSTLLRLIHEQHSSITLAPKLKPSFLYQDFRNLDLSHTVLDNVLATSIQDLATVRSVLAGLLFFGDDVYKTANVLSGGEKMRLSIAKLLTSEANALLLDEPTNYLDFPSLEAVQRMIREYPGTVLFVSHDQNFVKALATGILHISDGRILKEEAAATNAAPVTPAQKMLLEMRLTSLVSQISSAPPDQKTILEAEYAQTLLELKQM